MLDCFITWVFFNTFFLKAAINPTVKQLQANTFQMQKGTNTFLFYVCSGLLGHSLRTMCFNFPEHNRGSFWSLFFFALLSENALLVSIEEKNKVGGQLLWSGAIIPMSLHQRVLPPSTDRVNAVQHGKVLLMSIQCCMKEMFLVSEELWVWPISMPFY